jgi:pimeloyl-ACP methyl ester carboxylesterase
MRKLLYLHGLDGHLSPEKAAVLQAFGDVTAPQLDYRAAGFYHDQLRLYLDKPYDGVVGSSMGGFIALRMARRQNIPALVFNPALVQRTITPDLEGEPSQQHPDYNAAVYAIFGQEDKVIPWAESHAALVESLQPGQLHVRKVAGLGHRIPVPVFEEGLAWYVESAFGQPPTGSQLPTETR